MQSTSIFMADEVKKICEPLRKQFGINLFYFIRSYYHGALNGERIILCSDQNWGSDYFSLKHYEYELVNFPEAFKDKKHLISIWDGCQSEHDACKIFVHSQIKYGLSHFYYLTWIYQDYIEVYGFGVKEGQDHVIHKFLANIEIFQHFCQYFNYVGFELIEKAKESTFTVLLPHKEHFSNPHFIGLGPLQKEQLLKQMPIERIYLKGKYDGVYLSVEEAKTAILACQGLQYADIANLLSVSVPTIKYRMNSVREKCQAKNKNELLKIFYEEELIEQCKYALSGFAKS